MTDIRITMGCVLVHAYWDIITHDDVRIWEADLKAKYAKVNTGHDTKGQCTVWLDVDGHTMHSEPVDAPTVMTLPVPPDWRVMAEVARYTLRVAAYREGAR